MLYYIKEDCIIVEKNFFDIEGEWEEDIFIVLLDKDNRDGKLEQLGLGTIPFNFENSINSFDSMSSRNLVILMGHIDVKNEQEIFITNHEVSSVSVSIKHSKEKSSDRSCLSTLKGKNF